MTKLPTVKQPVCIGSVFKRYAIGRAVTTTFKKII